MGREKKKIRADFRKNRSSRARSGDWTRRYQADDAAVESTTPSERISGKGELTRKRTIVGANVDDDANGFDVQLDVDLTACLPGRVLSVRGLLSDVRTEDGRLFHCGVRRILRTLSTDLRHVVVAGDCVWFRPGASNEGTIERIEPRHGLLCRATRGRRHVMVANVDQLLIVGSAAEPSLKPNLIDRLVASAHKGQLRPLICINKVDLVDLAELQPIVGVFSQMGYQVLLLSARTGFGVERLRCALAGKASAVAGQSGVGKSSLLNAVDAILNLRVSEVSLSNQKGRHTTTNACLLPLSKGGYVVDTPGIRQFQLWDIIPSEVMGYFRDLRPYIHKCRYPNCTHTHETDCAVKDGVADGRLDLRRYEAYCHMFAGDDEDF